MKGKWGMGEKMKGGRRKERKREEKKLDLILSYLLRSLHFILRNSRSGVLNLLELADHY
jgi:hypothetical protein